MSDGGPRIPEHRKPPADHPTPLLLFEDDKRRRSGLVGRLRRHPGVVVLMLALATAWWVWHGLHRPSPGAPEPVAPVPTAQPATAAAPPGPRYRPGVLPLSDSVFSRPVGSAVTLTTRVMGEDSLPLPDTLVVFHVVQGRGTLQPDTARTDEEGLARTTLTLPPTPGDLVVSADLVGAQLPWARFSVTARSGIPTRARIFAGDRQKAAPGGLLARRLALRVSDQSGTAVAGVEVRFQVVGGGGVVAPSHAPTDSSGLAFTRWRLGNAPGDQYVAAMVPDISDALITFTATAVEPAAPAPATPQPTAQPTGSQGAAPSQLTAVTVTGRAFAVGGNFVCALSSGGASCRGGNDRGQRLRQSSGSFAAIAAGVSHACVLTVTGLAQCWGAGESGQLGDGSSADRATPDSVVTDARFSMLVAGVSHTCGLAAGGKVLCWGKNADGQLGDGSTRNRSTPGLISGSHTFVTIVAGWNHTCGVSTSGEVFCWGLNDRGQLGDGTLVDRLVPLNGPGTFQSIVAGSTHTCGIRGGQVLCWGDNRFGQLGDGTTQPHTNPALVQGLPEAAVRLAAGAVSTCALVASGRVYCWGQNVHGELGDGTRDNRTSPVPVAGDLTFRSIYAGGALTCGFTRDGVQYCWGLNQSGQLGDGTRESRSVPTRVGG